MITAYSVFADGLSQTPVFASPLDRGRFMANPKTGGPLRFTRLCLIKLLIDFAAARSGHPSTPMQTWGAARTANV